MSTNSTNAVSRFNLAVLNSFKDPTISEPLKKVFDSYFLSGEVEVLRGKEKDGVVSVPYRMKIDQTPVRGVLRFWEDGSVYDGRHKLNQALPPLTAQLFILSTFGEEELTEPIQDVGGSFFQSAKAVYNQRTVDLIELANQMVQVAEKEDEGPGGWDPDEFSNIVARYSSMIGVFPSDTFDSSRRRLAKAEEMIAKSADTYSGARSCVELGACQVEDRGACEAWHEGSIVTFAWKDTFVFYNPSRRDAHVEDSCRKEEEKKDSSICDSLRLPGCPGYGDRR